MRQVWPPFIAAAHAEIWLLVTAAPGSERYDVQTIT
jgi:hypothetical protein